MGALAGAPQGLVWQVPDQRPPNRRGLGLTGSLQPLRLILQAAAILIFTGAATGKALAGQPPIYERNLTLGLDGAELLPGELDGETKNLVLPQFRLFGAEGELLWAVSGNPKNFQKDLANKLGKPGEPIKGRSLRREANHFRRSGGAPFRFSSLPPADFTVVIYWMPDCGGCDDVKRFTRRVLKKNKDSSFNLLLVFSKFNFG